MGIRRGPVKAGRTFEDFDATMPNDYHKADPRQVDTLDGEA